MKKIGVIQIIDSLNTGGAEVMAVNTANILLEKKFNSHICVTRKEGPLINNINSNVGYLFLNRKKKLDFKSILKLRNYLYINDISIIHAHSSSYFIAFCVKIFIPRVKLIWHDHYGISQNLETRSIYPIRYISYFFKGIISVNSELKKWAQTKLLCTNIYFINNFPLFTSVDSKVKTNLKGKRDKRIIHLAAFREQKDHLNLINAFELFLVHNKEWTLHLVGAFNNDIYYKKILASIEQKELQNHIFVYGSCLDISNILNQSTIGILSSKSEGLPISLLEYGLAKLPVIVTDVGECAKVVINNISGFVVRPNNYIEISEKLQMLSDSSELRDKFAKEHQINVIKNYAVDSFLSKIITIYNS